MTTRNYSSTAADTTLTGTINDSQTTLVVGATTGFPAAPFSIIIAPGTVSQEIVLVTGIAGTTLTITRGYDSTPALAHTAGAVIQHCHAAIDFREAGAHVAASTGVHGVTGSVVGTSDTQSLTNKTIAGTNTINGFTADRFMKSDGTGKLASSTLALPTSAVLGLTDTQAPTNKDLSSGTNTFPAALATDAEVSTAVSTAVTTHAALTATHGATGAVMGTTNTQTVTNKNLTSATNTLPSDVVRFLASATAGINRSTSGSTQVVNTGFSAVNGGIYRISGYTEVMNDGDENFSTLAIRTDSVSTSFTGTLLVEGIKDHRLHDRREGIHLVGIFTASSTATVYAKLCLTAGGGSSTAVDAPSLITVERVG